jgi:hypothetical protein
MEGSDVGRTQLFWASSGRLGNAFTFQHGTTYALTMNTQRDHYIFSVAA